MVKRNGKTSWVPTLEWSNYFKYWSKWPCHLWLVQIYPKYDLTRCLANPNHFLHETSVAEPLHQLRDVLVPEITGNNSEPTWYEAITPDKV